MDSGETIRLLASITDEGVFERLATAVLRKADPLYARVSHPGVNAEGKTVKSPVDGIAFVPGAVPPHMIVIHHTITMGKDLDGKWLHDPTQVKVRAKGKKPTEPAGDVVKTAAIVADERTRTPDLRATLVLTSNQDPGQEIVRDVQAAGAAVGLAIDIWSRSRIADFLDNDPDGQWLRRQYLGIKEERVSESLLRKLSAMSLEAMAPPDDPAAWVERELDRVLASGDDQRAMFLIADSGSGKSVACYKRLRNNLDNGAFSLVLSDGDVAESATLDQALEATLRRLHPALAPGAGGAARQLGTATRPLLITVEDINRSGRGATLIERISRWSEGNAADADGWQIICPVWPQILSSLSEDGRKRINAKAVFARPLSKDEGALAVQRRRSCQGRAISEFDAAAISKALGHDPLLIALHDPDSAPTADQTIGQFIESSLQRLSATKEEYSPAEYRKALRNAAKSILQRRQLDPEWLSLLGWPEVVGDVAALRQLAQQGEIIRVAGTSAGERLAFRHDRVREWLLADGFVDLLAGGKPVDDLVSDPFFAEVIGLALASGFVANENISAVVEANPLAGFCALRHMNAPLQTPQQDVIDSVVRWLDTNSSNERAHRYFQWEAARMLAECEGQYVRPIVEKLRDQSWNALRARFRNGDLMGGIALCNQTELGTRVAGFEEFLDHVKTRYGKRLINSLNDFLSRPALSAWERSGGLRLAGHLIAPELSAAVTACWEADTDRENGLVDYLWAFAECSNDVAEAEVLLKPVCDLWATLPDKAAEEHSVSPRIQVAEYGVRWAFQRKPPESAIPYLIERAKSEDLKWAITILFEGMDQPDAVEFMVRELARRDAEIEGTGKFWPFSSRAADDFKRRQDETGRPMSERSRARLMPLWQSEAGDKHLRKHALRFWASTKSQGDLEALQSINESDSLFDQVLWQRVRRGDLTAIPALLEKLRVDSNGYWWQLGREYWTDEMTEALDAALGRRAKPIVSPEKSEPKGDWLDWILSEMVMNLPAGQAETILLRHWPNLCDSNYFVAAALFVATPALLGSVAEAVKESAEPKDLFKHLSMRAGRTRGMNGRRTGFYQAKQIEVLLPYLDHLSDSDIHYLWDTCNKHGWYSLRRQYLDGRLSQEWRSRELSEASAVAYLDDTLKQTFPWIDHWIDRGIESGWTRDEILNLVARWSDKKRTTKALEVLASALVHTGARANISLMNTAGIEPSHEAEAIRTDMTYAVKRRTLV